MAVVCFIPARMRCEILSQLHESHQGSVHTDDESHQGSVHTKSRAHLLVFWPGLDNDLDNIIFSCKHCQERLPSLSKEPILLKPKPTRPFQEIALDFCTHAAHNFLIASQIGPKSSMGANTATPRLLTTQADLLPLRHPGYRLVRPWPPVYF